ncbi:hypothetical protein [Streptomyces sp. NPDC056160]|uniref:hypothetical protein n=1 Tax=Streptomyces sp. NPDC056160 TaxID=3345731 RepID=UPI0035DE7EF6
MHWPPGGRGLGLSQAGSTDVGLRLDTATLATAIAGTLPAAVAAGVAVTAKTLRGQTP